MKMWFACVTGSGACEMPTMRKRFGRGVVAAMCWSVLVTPVAAQSATLSLLWDQPLINGQTLADAQAFTYTATINGGAKIPITATCAASASAPACFSGPIPGLKSGDVLILTVSNAFGMASSDPTTAPGSSPGKPINVTVVVKITVP